MSFLSDINYDNAKLLDFAGQFFHSSHKLYRNN